MSDYLGHLVDRALGLAPAVQPRLRSAYEPEPRQAAESPAVVEGAAEAPPSRSRDERPATPAPRPAPQPQAAGRAGESHEPPRATAPRVAAPPTGRPDEMETPLVEPPTARVREASRKAPETSPAVEARIEPAARGTEAAAITRPTAAARAVPPTVPAVPPTETRRAVSPPVVPSSEPEAETDEPLVPPSRDPVPSARRQAAPPPAGPRRGHVASEITPSVRGAGPRDRRDGPAAPPPAAPEIHVTIGRVEVRAILEQKGAPRRSAPGPRQSLDEYLKSRHDGKARP